MSVISTAFDYILQWKMGWKYNSLDPVNALSSWVWVIESLFPLTVHIFLTYFLVMLCHYSNRLITLSTYSIAMQWPRVRQLVQWNHMALLKFIDHKKVSIVIIFTHCLLIENIAIRQANIFSIFPSKIFLFVDDGRIT